MDSNSNSDVKKSTLPLLRSSKLDSIRPSLFGTNSVEISEKVNNSEASNSSEHTKFNPFLKCQDSDEETNAVPSDKEEKADPLAALTKNGIPKSNLFKNTAPEMPENSDFVFGQNVHERVTGDILQNTITSSSTDTDNKEHTNDSNNTSGSSDLLFSSVMQKNDSTNNENQSKESNSKSLTEAAREYEESRAQKRKYDEVETITGEEDENNVIEVINCKLFAFVALTYEERGRGCLRLNDSKKPGESSRVVFRTSGNLRVLLNTKIWANMVAERPSQKSLRLTAIDSSGQIKVFLVMARPDDIKLLHKLLNARIATEKLRSNSDEQNSSKTTVENETDNDIDEPSPKKQITENS